MGKPGEGEKADIIYSMVTRLEIGKLNAEIEKADPYTFEIINRVKDTRGSIVKKGLCIKTAIIFQ